MQQRTYEEGYLAGQRSVRQELLQAALDYVNGSVQGYERDPASTDFQRGHLAAFQELNRVLRTMVALTNDGFGG